MLQPAQPQPCPRSLHRSHGAWGRHPGIQCTFGFAATSATGISSSYRQPHCCQPAEAKAPAPPAPISERSCSPGLCPCKVTGKRSSWDPAQKKQTLISAEPSPLPRGKVMFPAWKGASPCSALASSGDRGCRLVHKEAQ